MIPAIQHDPAACRFHVRVDGHLAVLDYRLDGAVMSILHTGVPAPAGGRGIAAALTAAALEHARRSGWRVRPVCSYAARYLERHDGFADLVAP